MGVAAYIEQQLNPEKIDDSGVEAYLAGMETLRMSPTELHAAYPRPALLRRIERRLTVGRHRPGSKSQFAFSG